MASGLTREEIFAAADVVASQGEMPSIKSVRVQLGDRGSETTLLKYLREWKERLLLGSRGGCLFCSTLETDVAKLQQTIEQYQMLCSDLRIMILKMTVANNVVGKICPR